MRIEVYMKILTNRMVRDTIWLKGPMSRRELCDHLSVDPDNYSDELDEALRDLVDNEDIELDYNNGVYKGKVVLL
jgi:hypothetical protein